jgi:hypothetical protein
MALDELSKAGFTDIEEIVIDHLSYFNATKDGKRYYNLYVSDVATEFKLDDNVISVPVTLEYKKRKSKKS